MDVARLLIEAGADIDKARDDGCTPLYIASQKGHVEVARAADGGGGRHRQG